MARDHGRGGDGIAVKRYNSGCLIADAAILLAHASRCEDERSCAALLRASLITVANATEALALEVAHDLHPDLFKERGFRCDKLQAKWEKLGHPLPDCLLQTWMARCALVHSEPQHSRGKTIGLQLEESGLVIAIRCLVDHALAAWNGETQREIDQLRLALTLLPCAAKSIKWGSHLNS